MRKLVFGCLLLAATAAPAQEKAGQVLFAAGKVERVAPTGVASPLAKGDAVFEGDLLRTARGGHLQLQMRDDALLALRPGAELRLKAYSEDRAAFALVKGAFRSITGALGRRDKDAYRIEGHHVVLGIRGTDHEAAQRDDGLYDRVTEGGTYLAQARGKVDVAPGQTGFAPGHAGGVPTLLPATPEFLLAALPPAAAPTGPPPRERSPLDLQLPQLPAAARFDLPPVGGPLEHPGAQATGTGAGSRPALVLPDVSRPPRPGGKGRN